MLPACFTTEQGTVEVFLFVKLSLFCIRVVLCVCSNEHTQSEFSKINALCNLNSVVVSVRPNLIRHPTSANVKRQNWHVARIFIIGVFNLFERGKLMEMIY